VYFEDLNVGMKYKSRSLTITETHLVIFGHLTTDLNPIHMDAHYAAKYPFKKRIAHGMLTSALAQASVAPYLGAEDIATHLEDYYVYRDPVFIGDTLFTEYEITELSPKKKWGLVRVDLKTTNQDGRVVMHGYTKVGFYYRPKT